jgi:hypothetical protein
VIDAMTNQRLVLEDSKSSELLKPFLMGRDIKRYQPPKSDRYLILIPRGWTRQHSNNARDAWGWLKKNYPGIATHLEPFKEAAEKRYDKGEYWWELRTCDYYQEFQMVKIIIPAIVQTANYAIDNRKYYSNDKTSFIVTDELYVLGLLNSKVCDFFLHTVASTKHGGYFEYKPMYVSLLPIAPRPSGSTEAIKVTKLVEHILSLHQQLANAKTPTEVTLLQRQIASTDIQIDALVYELYGLTDEEIKIVEGG